MRRIAKKFNRLINKAEIVFGRKRVLSYPRNVQIEPTNRCNQRCIMCPRNSRLDVPIGDLSFVDFKKIISRLPALENLLLNGLGEPLLNRDICKMIAYVHGRGIDVSINSNCALINESLAEQLIESGLTLIKVSMDSADPQIYESIRGGKMEPVLDGIKALVKLKKERGIRYPRVWFNSIIMRDNCRKLVDILHLGEELGVDQVRFKPIGIFGVANNKEITIIGDELRSALKQALAKSQGIKIAHNLEKLLADFDIYYRPKEKTPCYSPWTELYIQYYGGVRLCCNFYSRKDDLGNILKEKSFKKIWNSHKMRQIRKEFKRGNTYFPVCQTCNRFQKNILIDNKIKKFLRP